MKIAMKKSGIFKELAKMTILPLLLLSFICSVVGSICVSTSLADEVNHELEHLADIMVSHLDTEYPGDYSVYKSEDELLFTKGDTILNANYTSIDSMKAMTQVEFSLFYEDMRIITTLCNGEGSRIIGSRANPRIVEDVMQSNSRAFYRNVDIFGIRYYCFYEPLCNSDGSCVGMLAAVMPAKRVQAMIGKRLIPFLLISILSVFLAFLWVGIHTKKMTKVIQKLSDNFERIASGELSNTVSPELLARKDEFGDMAHSIVDMQSSLRTLVEHDMLTGLFNRRFGHQRLNNAFEKYHNTSTTLSVALGDIDFFKKFNDTYGHDCGDVVLSTTASLIQHHVKDFGFCCRWGGEEFLIVLSKGSYEEHETLMEALISVIAGNQIVYEEQELHVTMTFGLINTCDCDSVETILREVDELLYEGKEAERNCLVKVIKEDA